MRIRKKQFILLYRYNPFICLPAAGPSYVPVPPCSPSMSSADWICFRYEHSSTFEIPLLDQKGFTVCFCDFICFVLRHFMNRIFWSMFIPICTTAFLCHGQTLCYESVTLTDIILRALFVEDKRFFCFFSCCRRIHEFVVERPPSNC